MDEARLKEQIHRYFIARYGEDYIYQAPETYRYVLERWMAAVARGDMDAADRAIDRIVLVFQGNS